MSFASERGQEDIPHGNKRAAGQDLTDGHTLFLTTRDTTDQVVADLGVHDMVEAENGAKNVQEYLGKPLAACCLA